MLQTQCLILPAVTGAALAPAITSRSFQEQAKSWIRLSFTGHPITPSFPSHQQLENESVEAALPLKAKAPQPPPILTHILFQRRGTVLADAWTGVK